MKSPATPSTLRFLNRRSIIRSLLHVPAVSRSELAKDVGLSAVTVGKIVDDLIKTHVLEGVASPDVADRVGRPGNLVRLDRSRHRFLAVQLGVTHTRISIAPLGFLGDDAWRTQLPTPTSAARWASQLAKAAAEYLSADLWGIVISVPGIVDHAANRALFSPNLHWIENQDFAALLKPLHKAPVLLVQEIQALAMGEFATNPDSKDFLLVDFSHGLGGSAVIGGELYKTPLPLNGELGHSRVIGNNRRCGCGAYGCVETLVSRRGLFQSMTPSDGIYDWEKVITHVNTRGLEPWLKESLDAAAASIGSALNVLGLRRVVVTGSINELPAEVTDYLANGIHQATLWARFGSVDVRFHPRHRVRGLVNAGLETMVLARTPV